MKDALAVAPITGCTLSPDGRYVAAHVQLYDALAGARVPTLWVRDLEAAAWWKVGHVNEVHHGATFAADGRLAAFREHGDLNDAVVLDPRRPEDPGTDVLGLPPKADALCWIGSPGQLACTGLDGKGTRRLWVWGALHERPRVVSPPGLPISGLTVAHASERWAMRVDPPRRVGDDDPAPAVLWAPSLTARPTPLSAPEPLRHAIAWSPDGRWLAGLARPDGVPLVQPRLWVVNPESPGSARRLLADHPGWITQLDWDHDSRALLVSLEQGTVGRLLRVHLDGRVQDVAPDQGFANAACVDRRVGRVVHLAQDVHRPQHLRVIEPDGRPGRRISAFDAPLRDLPFRPAEHVAWTAPDGLAIEGLLVLPEAPRPPLVVWLHGGPAEHLQRTFSAYFQLLVAEGWAVLAPNYRGSTGRDDAFLRASVGHLGEVDADDVLAGIDALGDRVDTTRVALVGWSYGGTLALLTAARRPSVRAVVAGAPVADWVTAFGAVSWPWVTRHYFPCAPWEDTRPYDAASPVRHLHALRAPTLFLHGEADALVPDSHPRLLHRLLQARGVPSDLRFFPGEGHVFGAPWAVQELLVRMTAWLRQHL